MPPEIAAYVDLVRRSAGPDRSPITAYPGSPLIVEPLRRPVDRIVLVEKHPQRSRRTARALERARRVTVLEQDGYAVLKGQLPPHERRGLVLIDPPYESDSRIRCGPRGADARPRALADRDVLRLVSANRARREPAVSSGAARVGNPPDPRCATLRAAA